MAFDVVTACTSATDSACGAAFKTQCFPDPTNCGIGDSTLLTIAEFDQLIPAIVMVMGTAWIFKFVVRQLGVLR